MSSDVRARKARSVPNALTLGVVGIDAVLVAWMVCFWSRNDLLGVLALLSVAAAFWVKPMDRVAAPAMILLWGWVAYGISDALDKPSSFVWVATILAGLLAVGLHARLLPARTGLARAFVAGR